MPVPLEGISLVIDESFSFHNAYKKVDAEIQKPDELQPHMKKYVDWKVRNTFFSWKKRCDIVVVENPETGKVKFLVRPAINSMNQVIATLFASDVWGVDQEQAALQTLGGMLKYRQFKQYLLTGMFLEQSPRSHVTYIFRRLRPTIALAAFRPKEKGDGDATMLCGMCMHPIAYYAGSWAGAMCPTDDIIAHLSLMRGDEKMFWRRCNQHEPHRPEAGI
jgi:hypothetical protein